MEFVQLIEYNKRNSFLKNHVQNDVGRLVLDLVSAAYFQYISIAFNLAYNNNKLYKTLDYWSRDILNFNFLEKSGNSFFTTPCLWFFKKNVSHIIFSLQTKFHCWIAIAMGILDNMCIEIFDVISFEINLIFLIKLFFYMTKMSR